MAGHDLLARRRCRLGLLPVLLGLFLLGGCKPDPYPEQLTYPLRSELLVLKTPGEDKIPYSRLDPLGKLDDSIATLKGKPGSELIDPQEISESDRKTLETVLEGMFGRPAYPLVGAPAASLRELKEKQKIDLDEAILFDGSILYRRHCLHCHGVSGNGRGPTAAWINPHPRDFRHDPEKTVFKFVSSENGFPLREDLLRTLRHGLDGSAMPGFKYLTEAELDALISYVVHLNIRGSVEFALIDALQKRASLRGRPEEIRAEAKDATARALDRWKQATPVEVKPYPSEYGDINSPPAESIERGHELFIGTGICRTCHLDYGRQAAFRYDIWGTMVRPNNLTAGIYRAGRRPVDFYYRIALGIGPSGMQKAADEVKNDPKKMWDLVNFVRTLPYPAMLPPKVREQVYGRSGQK